MGWGGGGTGEPAGEGRQLARQRKEERSECKGPESGVCGHASGASAPEPAEPAGLAEVKQQLPDVHH